MGFLMSNQSTQTERSSKKATRGGGKSRAGVGACADRDCRAEFGPGGPTSYGAQARALGVPVLQPIGDRYYGLRDFTIVDPDGYGLRFASYLDPNNVPSGE